MESLEQKKKRERKGEVEGEGEFFFLFNTVETSPEYQWAFILVKYTSTNKSRIYARLL